MAFNLRVATFNCNNLFSRPKIFRSSETRSQELLGYVTKLEAELRKDVFDHAEINRLKGLLSGYATINDVRGKHDSAVGCKDWLGWVELTRGGAEDVAIDNTARVISDIDADVICLMEIEDRFSLQKFHDDLVVERFLQPANKQGYERILLLDGNDDRRIDVAVMSRRPVKSLCTHIHERIEYNGNRVKTFSRDCLEVEIELPEGKNLRVLVNHLKSQGYSPPDDPNSRRRREGQARRVAELCDEHDLQNDYLIVAGDLNSKPSDSSVLPLTTKAGLYNVNLNLPENERGTYKTSKDQLDYLLISEALRPKLQGVRIERRGVYTRTNKWTPYPTVVGTRTQASDHGSVVADFKF
jgi:endonuclease/exonuclease/phosphatase family metal-dependent hydrolase